MKGFSAYRLAQVASVLLWLALVSGCERQNTPWDYQITAHHIKLDLHPDSRSFLALDTINIKYRKSVTEFYFFLNKNITIHRVGVGHQELTCSALDSLTGTPFAGRTDLLPLESICYAIQLPPNFNPATIDILYDGDIADSLRQSLMLKSLAGLTTLSDEPAKNLFHHENWYPSLPYGDCDFAITIQTPGSNQRIL